MSKVKKVFLYILLCLALALLGWCFVSYIINPSGTTWTLNYIWSLLNEPLPIIGITSIALFVFIWNVVVFIRKNQPKKELSALRQENEKLKQENEKFKKQAQQELLDLRALHQKSTEQLSYVCSMSTNQKIKNFGKELLGYGESIDSETKAN